MNGFGPSFRAETRDLLRAPLCWVSAVATAAAAWTLGRHAPIRDNGYVVYQAALQAAGLTASFFLLGIAATTVAGERTRGTVRWLLPRPVTRAGFVAGKATALALLALVLLCIAVAVSLGVAQQYGFGDVKAEAVAEDGGGFEYFEEEVVPPVFRQATMRRRTAWATLLVLPSLLTATGLGLFVSSLLPSAAGAVIAALALAIPLTFLPEVLGLSEKAALLLPFSAADAFLHEIGEFGRRLATAEWPDYGAGSLAGALVGAVGLPVLGALVFARLDLTD